MAGEGGKELQVTTPSSYVPACRVCPAAAHNGSLEKAQHAAQQRGPGVRHRRCKPAWEQKLEPDGQHKGAGAAGAIRAVVVGWAPRDIMY